MGKEIDTEITKNYTPSDEELEEQIEYIYSAVYKNAIEDDEGNLITQRVKEILRNNYIMANMASDVYAYVTNGRVVNPMTLPDSIKEAYEEALREFIHTNKNSIKKLINTIEQRESEMD